MFPMNNKMAMLGGMGSMMGNPYTAMNPWAAASRFGSAMGFPGMGGAPNQGMLMAMAQKLKQMQAFNPMPAQQAERNALAAYTRQPMTPQMPQPSMGWGQIPAMNSMPSMPSAPMMMGPRPAMGMLGGMADPANGMAQTAQAQRPFMNRFGGMGGM